MLNLILALISTISLAKLETFSIEIQEKDTSCEKLADNILKCIPTTCSVEYYVNGEKNSLNKETYKIKPVAKNKCVVFLSNKVVLSTRVTAYEFNEEELKHASSYLKLFFKYTKMSVIKETNCCNNDVLKKTYCPAFINDKSVLYIFDNKVYYSCDTKRMVFPLKVKRIDY